MVKGLTKNKRGDGMNAELKKQLIKQAKKRHSKIYPCGKMTSLRECFTELEDRMLFWYNTKDRNTHVVMSARCIGNKMIFGL